MIKAIIPAAAKCPMPVPVLLNNVDHYNLRVVTARGAVWGDAVNQVTVFPTEFEALSREYVIAFRRDEAGKFRAVVLLGFARDENLFLAGDRWDAHHVPALMQRGPFSIGMPAAGFQGEAMIHVDLEDPRVGREQGERVFLDHGGNAPYLEHVAGVLQAVYRGTQVAPAMFDTFVDAGLLEEATVQIEAATGQLFTVTGVWTLSAERFAALDASALARLHAGDHLRRAVWMISSLGNLPALVDRKLARNAGR